MKIGETPALFVGAAWDTALDGNVRTLIERDLLAPFLLRQRWFGGKARRAARGPLRRLGAAPPRPAAAVPDPRRSAVRRRRARDLLSAAGRSARPPTPGASRNGRRAPCSPASPARGKASCSTPGSTIASPGRCSRRSRRTKRPAPGAARCTRIQTSMFAALRGTRGAADRAHVGRTDQHLPDLRRPPDPEAVPAAEKGVNPDFEIGQYLTEVVRYPRVPAVAGALEYRGAAEQPTDHRHGAAAAREPGRRLAARDRRTEPVLRSDRGPARPDNAPAQDVHGRWRRPWPRGRSWT